MNIRIGSSWCIVRGDDGWSRWLGTEFFVYDIASDGDYKVFVYRSDVELNELDYRVQTISPELFVNMVEITPLTTKKQFV